MITLTVYFGPDEWTAPRDLHSMLDADDETLKFIDNYHLHLIAPAEIKEKDFSKFHSEFSLVMKYIKYSADKKQFEKEVGWNKDFESVSKPTADVIRAITGYDIDIIENEGKVNMCEAIRGLKEDAWIEGRAEGEIKILAELIKDGILTEKAAAEKAGMTPEEFRKKAAVFNNSLNA